MNAKPALVRPQLASEFDEYVALWVSRLSANETAALLEVNQGMYAEELRQLIGLTPLEGRHLTVMMVGFTHRSIQ